MLNFLRRGWLEDRQGRKHWNRIRLAPAKLLVRYKIEGAVLGNRPAQRPAELLTLRIWFHADNLIIRRERQRKRIGGVQATVPEKPEQRAVQGVASAPGDDVDHAAPRFAVLGRIICAVNLKFLYGLLADGRAHAAARVVGLAAIHADVVPTPVRAVKR